MEPSPSLAATIVLRSSDGEAHLGSRVAIDPASGAMRPDVEEASGAPDAPALASLRPASGRWLLDAAPEGRISINGVAVAGARMVNAGDVITVAGSQFLVEEAQPRSLALRRFDLEGTDTFPPVGDSVRTLSAPLEDLPVELGDVPSVEGAAPVRAARAPRSRLNYAGSPTRAPLLAALPAFALLKPIAPDPHPATALHKSLGPSSPQT